METEHQYCTPERNAQIIIELLKARNIRRVIVSPGSTNVAVVGSMQNDSFFEMYSCIDERSAAYMACGMAAESGAPVVLSCTGATAFRNYYPGLTEAYYSKLPIIALTSSHDARELGHLKDQVTDRTHFPSDLVKCSVFLQTIKDEMDEWEVTIKANDALLELSHHGIGPVHIDVETMHDRTFLQKQVHPVRVIERYTLADKLPSLPQGKIAVFIGSHPRCSHDLIEAIDSFCEQNNAIVIGDANNGYYGRYRINNRIIEAQKSSHEILHTDLVIHIGEVACFDAALFHTKQIWRVSEDGKLRDRAQKLTFVFEMSELSFFNYYNKNQNAVITTLYEQCLSFQQNIMLHIPDLPFSNIWVASQLYDKLPTKSVLHLGILSPLRSWGLFQIPNDISVYCNQGGFGIDGNMSTMIGASLVHPESLFFAVVGDLSFFYDMNCLGNRHIGKNVRILLINNGDGCEFQLSGHMDGVFSHEKIGAYISAGGHYCNKAKDLVRNYVTALGFDYLQASNKKDFINSFETFISPMREKPIVYEINTLDNNEDLALQLICNILPYDNKNDAQKFSLNKEIKNIYKIIAKK